MVKLMVLALFALILVIVTDAGRVQWTNYGACAVDAIRTEYMAIEFALWKEVDKNSITDKKETLKKIFDLHRKFVTENITYSMTDNEHLVLNQIDQNGLMEKNLMTVNSLFEPFHTFVEHSTDEYDELAGTDFAETVLNDDQNVNDALEQIYEAMVRQKWYYLAKLKSQKLVCTMMQSVQQTLFQLYSAISMAELKGYTMIQFSLMLLKTYEKGNYPREIRQMREQFVERTVQTQSLLNKILEEADRTVWRCDPSDEYVHGETYEEITRLLQGYIENEVDLNNDNTCKENCAAYQYAENHGCYAEMYCSKQPKCNGKLLNCQFVDSDMLICPSKSTSDRRYEFIEYENGRILGNPGTCLRGTTKVDSWWRWLFWHCSYCLCMCDEQGVKSDRYFNLRESVSTVTKNRVVTGLRFRKFNRIMHLQIQEGQLSARGMVNESTVQWKPVSDYGLLDRGIENGVDYHTMTWDKRAIDLDDLIAPASHVVTGVRFRVVGTHLNLEIRQTEADFVTGRLIDPEHTSVWISNDNTERTDQKRTAVKLNRPDVPTRCKSISKITSTSNQYIEFTHTDLDADVAQTTVPFLDAQDVVTDPPVALSGAGIYHKGSDHCGGFVAPKLFTYDFKHHVIPRYIGAT